MIDSITGIFPDMHAIMKTCKRVLTKEEEELVVSTFPVLYKKAIDKGEIPEDLFTVSNLLFPTI